MSSSRDYKLPKKRISDVITSEIQSRLITFDVNISANQLFHTTTCTVLSYLILINLIKLTINIINYFE